MSIEKETLFVSFSGGRTSAYMCWWLLNNKSDVYDFIFLFANTGQEHENTLKFVDQCDKAFGLNLVWLEATVSPEKGRGTLFTVVDYKTASVFGRPFKAVIEKYGISNAAWPHCTRELKIAPMEAYMQSVGFKRSHKRAIGIRSDEMDRMDFKSIESGRIVYPLIKFKPTTKAEIRYWWAEQDFDLDVDEHYGNCVTCWKKSDRKLYTIAKNEPERFKFFDNMEKKYSEVSPMEGEKRSFFRRNRTTENIIASSLDSFVEFIDCMPELQLKLDIDDLDREESCGASCEAG